MAFAIALFTGMRRQEIERLQPEDFACTIQCDGHGACAAWILGQIGHLHRIERQLRETEAGPALREAVGAAQSRMIHRRLKAVIDQLALRAILPKSKLVDALRYAARQWSKLEVYLVDGRIEIDTNLVGNAIRPTKLGAKNWLFAGCREAGHRAAVLYTVDTAALPAAGGNPPRRPQCISVQPAMDDSNDPCQDEKQERWNLTVRRNQCAEPQKCEGSGGQMDGNRKFAAQPARKQGRAE